MYDSHGRLVWDSRRTHVGDSCGRLVWEILYGTHMGLTWETRVRDSCGRLIWDLHGTSMVVYCHSQASHMAVSLDSHGSNLGLACETHVALTKSSRFNHTELV